MVEKNEMNGDVPVSDMRRAVCAAEKMCSFLRFHSEFVTFLSDKIFNKSSSLI